MGRVKVRIVFALVAATAWAGEAIFLAVNAGAFGSLPRALRWSSRFLTDWTGILVAVVATAAALGRRRLASPFWLALATVAAVLVGTMFAALGGWAALDLGRPLGISSVLAHVVAPWAMLFAWVIAADHGGLEWRDVPRFTLFPLAYLAQALVRGALGEGYPYPEIDTDRVGWGAALAFAGAVTLLFVLLGLLLAWVDRRLARLPSWRPRPTSPPWD